MKFTSLASHEPEPVDDDQEITQKRVALQATSDNTPNIPPTITPTNPATEELSPILPTSTTIDSETSQSDDTLPVSEQAVHPHAHTNKHPGLTRRSALLMIVLLSMIVLHALTIGPTQFLGTQGWSFVLNGSGTSNTNLLGGTSHPIQHPKPGATAQPQLTPQQYIKLIVSRMSLDQKLGQMMLIQFVGPTYSADLSSMISQYNVGAVLIFTANGNIQSKQQLTGLIQQMQHNSSIPLAIAIDQEGGTVDRLASLDGPSPAAATIGATGNPNVARADGIKTAQALASYGINLNLAPVVDVTNVYNPQMYDRTFGTTPDLVTQMAGAYLDGLQQSGKVLGTLKHFPGLGDVGVDPHLGLPYLTRSLAQLEQIDWKPYRTLIQQGNVHAIMVTHEIVTAVDSSVPSSLSHKLITGILRQQFGFQGVIMTDSLTMEGISAYYTEGQAAAMAVEAGDDLLMGAATPADVANMVEGIKQAMNNGTITQQQIDTSVERILMLKYDLGLLPLPAN